MLKNGVIPVISTLLLSALFSGTAAFSAPLPKENRVERAFSAFWKAKNRKARKRAAKKIIKANPSFQYVWDQLKKGRTYPVNAKRGRQVESRSGVMGKKNFYSFYIPKSYDPSKAYPVTFYLHGGVNRPPYKKSERWFRFEESAWHEDRISVFPASWGGSMWWQFDQISNLAAILEEIKRKYNVDENRVYMLGLSDGGTGAYYQAFHNSTPWANFMVFIGHMKVLVNRKDNRVEGFMHTVNLRNRPFLIINCGHDHLYPISSVEPYLDLLTEAGVEYTFRPKPFRGHTIRWWPEEQNLIDTFRNTHSRNPYPNQLTWQTDSPESYGRINWLKIDTLGQVNGEPSLNGFNIVIRGPNMPPPGIVFDDRVKDKLLVYKVVGGSLAAYAGLQKGDVLLAADRIELKTKEQLYNKIKSTVKGKKFYLKVLRDQQYYRAEIIIPDIKGEKKSFQAFPPAKSSGRVRIKCDGNKITAVTMGVKTFTLLLSPEQFNFEQPIVVTANGKTMYSQKPEKNVKTLLKWAARDQDRTMLFGAEIKIHLQ